MNTTDRCSDNLFSPAVSCPTEDSLDFTLLFEQSIFSIIPCALLILLVPFELRRTWQSANKTLPNNIGAFKAITGFALIGSQLALVVLWSRNDNVETAIANATLYLVATIAGCALLVLQHSRSVRPSSLLGIFLFFLVLFDAVQVRTLFLRGSYTAIASVLATAMALKLILLTLEMVNKRSYLKKPYSQFPAETLSSIFNRSLFWWLHSTFRQGLRTGITIDTLCDIDIALESEPIQSRTLQTWKKYAGKGRYALVFALTSALRWPLLTVVLPRLCLIAFNYTQPFLIQRAVSLLEETVDEKTTNYGRGLIGATALVYLGIAVSTALYQYQLCRVMAMLRAATISLIYVTALEAPAGAANDEAQTVTLMSTDVDRSVNALELVYETWARLLEIAIGTWLLARQMGVISIAPIIVSVLCFAYQTWLARYMSPRQLPWIQAIQRRVGKTSSVLHNMKAVRMMGLTDQIENLLQAERIRELDLSKRFRWMIVWINIVASMPQILTPLATFIAYAIRAQVQHDDRLSTAKAFTSLAIVSLITSPTVGLLASIPAVRVAEGCLDRIQKFLLLPAAQKNGHDSSVNNPMSTCSHHEMATLDSTMNLEPNRPLIDLKEVDLRPQKDANVVLQNVNFSILKSTQTMIAGPVGSGKTTLLKGILAEISPVKGALSVLTKSLGYCSQTPWLPNGAFRDVLCGSVQFEETWYDTVTYACDLKEVIQQLPQADASMIGSRGSILSGGQKQRLALARAVYARSSLLLLDDVLSALDRETENRISERLLSKDGLLKKLNCTVVLVTSTLRHASMADKIIVLNPETKTAKVHIPEELTEMTDLLLVSNPERKTSVSNVESDQVKRKLDKPGNAIEGAKLEDAEDLARRTGDISLYLYYYRCIGLSRTLLTLFILGVFTFVSNYPRFWIQWYTEDPSSRYLVFIGVYIMLVIIGSMSQGAMIWQIMINIVPKSGAEIHRILLRTVMHARMEFFSTVDSGVILNRFSQDMTLVDAVLPTAAFGTFLAVLQCIAQLIFIALGSSYMGLFIPITIVAVYFLQIVYLRTSRQLRFLDLEAKSPLFTHFLETIEGLVTIRAFDWRSSSVKANLKWLDQSQKPFYLLLCIQRWLVLVLDLMVAAVATIMVALAFSLRSTTSGGSLGVALTAVLSFSQALQDLMLGWTQMETSLGAIARTKNLETAIRREDANDEVQQPPHDWPCDGSIEFRNVSAAYDNESIVLKNVSFCVKPKQKIGIIGRSGSGKSTLLSVLLRLLDLSPDNGSDVTGQIFIDNLSIATIPRAYLRSCVLSIPQEALTLPGASIRFNANPFNGGKDEKDCDELIIESLRKVGLLDLVEARGGLDKQMTSDTLSEGEAQLFAIARTIAKKDLTEKASAQFPGQLPRPHRILLLDEATSHLDTGTDARIQSLIRQEFSEFTIITIAHRLDSIRDSDMVGVMENGHLCEYGPLAQMLGKIPK